MEDQEMGVFSNFDVSSYSIAFQLKSILEYENIDLCTGWGRQKGLGHIVSVSDSTELKKCISRPMIWRCPIPINLSFLEHTTTVGSKWCQPAGAGKLLTAHTLIFHDGIANEPSNVSRVRSPFNP